MCSLMYIYIGSTLRETSVLPDIYIYIGSTLRETSVLHDVYI